MSLSTLTRGMSSRAGRATLGLMAIALLPGASALGQTSPVHIPDRPEQLEFRPLEFDPPDASEFRHELSSGVPVYMAPSDEFPLVTIRFSFKGGSYLDPADKTGLASMTGAMIRRGGTESVSAEDLDEQFDFLAAIASTGSGATTSTASLNSLASNLDEAFELFMDMLRNPGFEEEKVELYREEAIERMKQRNDHAQDILSREWSALMYGEDFYAARQTTIGTINAISIGDLHDFHSRVFQPGNLIIGVTGDFDPRAMLDRLERALRGWSMGETMPDPPSSDHAPAPGVYHVEKDIPQGRVFLGHRGVTRDHPDYFPLLLMNDILGGGGFTSRIVSRVRSDEGLAYSAGSSMMMPAWHKGEFRALFQSKNRTVALATKIILDEVERIRSEPVSERELETSKNSFIETFPRRFESKEAMINTFIDDEWTGREAGYWDAYRENIRAVTKEDVMNAARRHLHPNRMAVMIVGVWDEIAAGDLEGRASMADFYGGRRNELPLRDPLTLKPMN